MEAPRASGIRRAQPADAARLLEIRREAILALAVPALSLQQAMNWAASRNLEWMERVIATHALWVASGEARITGWIGIEGRRVIGLYVDPSCASRGVGSRLLAFAEGYLSSLGASAIELEASWNAEEFYLHRGYVPLAERPPDGPRPMRKALGSWLEGETEDTDVRL